MRHATLILLLALFAAYPVQAGNLGRLFFTPEQRTQLEHGRTRNTATATPEASHEEGKTSSVMTVNGIVQKKGGARTVWINGVAQSAGNSDEYSPEALPVFVPGQPLPVKMKVGQKLAVDQPAQPKPPVFAPQKSPAPATQKKQPEDDD